MLSMVCAYAPQSQGWSSVNPRFDFHYSSMFQSTKVQKRFTRVHTLLRTFIISVALVGFETKKMLYSSNISVVGIICLIASWEEFAKIGIIKHPKITKFPHIGREFRHYKIISYVMS